MVGLDGHKILSHPGIRSQDCPASRDYTIPVVQFPVSETNFNPQDGGKISSESYETSYMVCERRRALSEQHLLYLCAADPKSIPVKMEADNTSEISE